MSTMELDFADRLAHLAAMLVALRHDGCSDDSEKEDLTDACMKLARALRDEYFSRAIVSEGANEALIAAAPALFEAAEAAAAVLAKGRWRLDSPDPEAVALRKLLEALGAAKGSERGAS